MRAWVGGPIEAVSLGTKTERENERAALTALIDYVVETTCKSHPMLGRDGADVIRQNLSETVLNS